MNMIEAANFLLNYESKGDLDADYERAFRQLSEAADAREREKAQDQSASLTCDPRAVLRVLVDDYDAETVIEWVENIYAD